MIMGWRPGMTSKSDLLGVWTCVSSIHYVGFGTAASMGRECHTYSRCGRHHTISAFTAPTCCQIIATRHNKSTPDHALATPSWGKNPSPMTACWPNASQACWDKIKNIFFSITKHGILYTPGKSKGGGQKSLYHQCPYLPLCRVDRDSIQIIKKDVERYRYCSCLSDSTPFTHLLAKPIMEWWIHNKIMDVRRINLEKSPYSPWFTASNMKISEVWENNL